MPIGAVLETALDALDKAIELAEGANPARALPITVPLNSSAIRQVTYTEVTGSLVINMKDGAVLEYPGIPRETFDGLISASSPGSYYNQHIRSRRT